MAAELIRLCTWEIVAITLYSETLTEARLSLINNYNINDGTDTLYNVTYLQFMDQTVAVNSLAPPPSVVHPNNVKLADSR